MLTILALYHSYSADDSLLLDVFDRARAMGEWLLARRGESLRWGESDPRYGIPPGTDEGDDFKAYDAAVRSCVCMRLCVGGIHTHMQGMKALSLKMRVHACRCSTCIRRRRATGTQAQPRPNAIYICSAPNCLVW